LGGVSALSLLWPKLIFVLPLFVIAAGATVWQAILSAAQASFPSAPRSWFVRARLYLLTAGLHLIQPVARLLGRARHGLTAFRRRVPNARKLPFPKQRTIWSEEWRAPEQILEQMVVALRREGAVLVLGGAYDRWDLEVRGGLLGAARLFMTVEEHGAGKQLFRFRSWPKFGLEGVIAVIVFAGLALGAALDQYWWAYDILALVALALLGRMVLEAAGAMAAIQAVLKNGFADEK
jgi:uracil-DNA glycosylase